MDDSHCHSPRPLVSICAARIYSPRRKWCIASAHGKSHLVGTDVSRPSRSQADLQPTINVDDAQIGDGRVVEGSGRDKSVPTAEPKKARVNALHLGILLGGGSLIYFNMNSWIAVYNTATHHAGITSLALGVLNVAQLPVSLGVTFFAQWLAGRRSPFIIAGIICGIAITGWVFTPAALGTLVGCFSGRQFRARLHARYRSAAIAGKLRMR